MEEFDMFTLDDVDAAFDKIVQLKYNQSINMKGISFFVRVFRFYEYSVPVSYDFTQRLLSSRFKSSWE